MKKLLIAIMVGITLMFTASTIQAGALDDEIKRFCVDKWETNYSMIEHCRKTQKDAARKLYFWNKENREKPDAKKISVQCLSKWYDKTTDTANYSMWYYCVDKQWKAYQNLNK